MIRLIWNNCGGNPTRGLEIGVEQGRTSRMLLKHFPTLHLTGIDPYEPVGKDTALYAWAEQNPGKTRSIRHVHRTKDEHLQRRDEALRAVSTWKDRFTLMEIPSHEAAATVGDGFDFVFIDGDHSNCRSDVRDFWPKIRPGGALIGHDLGSVSSRRGIWDVDQAVREFEAETGLELQLERAHLWAFKKPDKGNGAPSETQTTPDRHPRSDVSTIGGGLSIG